MAIKVVMPEMGEGVVEGTISRWLKQVGESVEQYEPLLEIETDKVTTEATAEEAGTLLEILVPEGETVDVGTVLATIGQPGEASPKNGSAPAKEAAPKPEPIPEPAAPAPVTTATAVSQPKPQRYTGRISPVVGRIAAEHEVDLNLVTGTGRDGRITKNDILTHIEQRHTQPTPQPQPEPVTLSSGHPVTRSPVHPVTVSPEHAAGEIVPLTNMRRAIAEHMVRSVQTSPHVTTVFEFDFTAVAQHHAAHKAQFARDGANLTFTAYIVTATVEALKQHPLVNSTFTEAGIELKRQINIGMAAAIDDGLIVPVIKGADGMNLLGLARTINDLTERARRKQLQPGDVQGGTFSITNHGTSGSLFATPIINQPQCGILGVGKIEKRVKVINDAIAIRPLAYVSFTFDHRILDGKTADDFVSSIKQVIETWP
ncbi:MAG: 2-oxo acid dehydrogenase subunit E2 [Anaerolineaceae bacterium]|nr:2-oxo acid dehydrogenase subunit E2 [Anaerolineaceae bacterium]